MKVKPLTGCLGAEITDADITSDTDWPAIRQAFIDHGVVVIRNQNVSPDDHLGFARRWGQINVNRFFKALDSHPEIAIVLKEPDQAKAIGEVWHTDHSYDDIPAMGSILRAIETPPSGGDTVFTSMYAAYEALSVPMRAFLEQCTAVHSSRHAFGIKTTNDETVKTGRIGNATAATQDARHPMIIRHPLSNRPALYVNPQFTTHIDGFSKAESDAILGFLYDHALQAAHQCRISWNVGDVTMWDNRATWHQAINDYHGHRRYMHRVTVEGCALDAWAD